MESYENPTKSEKNLKKPVPRKDSQINDEPEEAEINPAKLDRELLEADKTGRDNSKGHEPYEFKKGKHPLGKLVGQGGYGTSGTSGTNSGGLQGYQSGLGSAGSQNGSTGYNSGSLGMGRDTN